MTANKGKNESLPIKGAASSYLILVNSSYEIKQQPFALSDLHILLTLARPPEVRMARCSNATTIYLSKYFTQRV